MERAAARADPGELERVADFQLGAELITKPPAECLVVIEVVEVLKTQLSNFRRVILAEIQARAIREVEGIVELPAADGYDTAHLNAHFGRWCDPTIIKRERLAGQLVDPLRIQPLRE